MPAVLIATLGSEPQVVALATQLLMRQGVLLCGVQALHTDARLAPIAQSLPKLQAIFAAHAEWPPLQTVAVPCADVLAQEEMDLFAEVLYRELKRWQAADVQIHLLLAGGRKPMAMVGMTVAQLLLDADDRVWYLHSNEELRIERRPVLEAGDRAELVAIALPQFRAAPARLTRLFQAETPAAARQALAEEQMRRARYFVEQELTRAEREVAALVAQSVLTTEELAGRLQKSPKTISNQLNSIYSKLESAFGLQPDGGVKREFLRRELGGYFAEIGN
jgi:CRISPR-associated protein Csx14